MEAQSQNSEGATHRVSCPHCAALYDVPVREIPDGGRRLQCCACGSVWREIIRPAATPPQTPAKDEEPPTEDAPAPQDGPSSAVSPDISPEVARVLRTEAEREIGARRAERGDPPLKAPAADTPAVAAKSETPKLPQRSGGGFAVGMLLAVTAWTLATGVYLWSDGIVRLVPSLAGVMDWYIGAGDWLLAWLRAAARFVQDLAAG